MQLPTAKDTRWQRYDQSAGLTTLAAHPNGRMHNRLLNSSVLSKNTLWTDFVAELDQFGAARYR